MKRKKLWFIILSIFISASLFGQREDSYSLKKLGKLNTLSSNEIKSSRWSIGGETLDRDYADYQFYKVYLGNSGAKRIRLQGGWAKVEQEKGKYDFSWLDKIIDDAKSRGVEPWVQLSYGNPIYEGGGQPILAGGIPTSDEALEAWDNWVLAMVHHFKDRVVEWEIWNEPDISDKFNAAQYAAFYERTADLVKREQPDARLIALGLATLSKLPYVDTLFQYLEARNKLDYVDAVSYHGYTYRPEDNYKSYKKLRQLVKSYDPDIELWQGENGAPSTGVGQAVGALTKQDWSEITQAKWVLRRMIGDMAHKVDVTNIFQISDMYYGATDHLKGYNSKGLLKARPDKSIERPKLAYYVYQNIATVFSGNVEKVEDVKVKNPDKDVVIYVYEKDNKTGNAVTIWLAEAKPVENYRVKKLDFSICQADFSLPVILDPLTGEIFSIPKKNYKKEKGCWMFSDIPVTDSPIILIDESWLSFKQE